MAKGVKWVKTKRSKDKSARNSGTAVLKFSSQNI